MRLNQPTCTLLEGYATRRKILRLVALLFACLSMLAIFMPFVSLGIKTNVVIVSGVQLLAYNLRVDNLSITFSFLQRAGLIAMMFGGVVGLFFLVAKKQPPKASVLFIVSTFLTLMQLPLMSQLALRVTREGGEKLSFSLSIGFYIMLVGFVIAALLSISELGLEMSAELVLRGIAMFSIGMVLVMTLYMFISGLPAIKEIGLFSFLFNTRWAPTSDAPSYGIAYMILASIFACAGAIAIGVPIGLMTAVFLSDLAPRWMARIVQPAIELLASIPSVVYGFWGMRVLVPFIREFFMKRNIMSTGSGLLAVIIVLAIMILPTITRVAQTSLQSVPPTYKEASLALGNTPISTIFDIQIPAAKSGILAGVILGVGRAIGETMAVIMVAGNIVQFPKLMGSIRPMTAGIAFEMGYADAGLHRQALFAIGLVLFIFIMIVNMMFLFLSRRGVKIDGKN